MNSTSPAQLDEDIGKLQDARSIWVKTPLPERARLLRDCLQGMGEVAEAMVEAGCRAKGIPDGSRAVGEEWLGGPMTIIRYLRLLLQTLEDVKYFGAPRLFEAGIRLRKDGQIQVPVFPQGAFDKLMFAGFEGWVWLEPGVTQGEVQPGMARLYRQPQDPESGKVALVLGAGNVASIGPGDLLHKLFCENQVVLLKMNPVNEYLGPLLLRGLGPLAEAGLFRLAYGGAEVGERLVHHPGIEEIHITGSDTVHDIIVWGAPGGEQERNRAAGTPRLRKRITSELGCVTPVIVVPGPWTDRELDHQAENIATMVANNASFNCNAAKVLVCSAAWPLRRPLLERVERVLGNLPPRAAYYPGSDRKYELFMDSHPEAHRLGKRDGGVIPWTTIFDVSPDREDDVVFRKEAWCAIVAETALPASEPAAFLDQAVRFCNERLWGTLSCSLLVHPETERVLGPSLDDAIASLRYGSVVVNHWGALSYGLCSTVWGAFPGHTLEDIQSGIGLVHNTLMLDRPQRSVVRGPFFPRPKPPWFVTHRHAPCVGRHLTRFEQNPSISRFVPVAYHALRG